MGVEIERKFLVSGDGWRDHAGTGRVFRQGYLTTAAERTVRVRRAGDRAWLTIKGRPEGRVRAEFEYEIPPADADDLLALCEATPIDKTRYRVEHAGYVWEVDVFAGANAPLVLAEVELPDAEAEVALPGWVGAEVTDDSRYQNARLSREPYDGWGAAGQD